MNRRNFIRGLLGSVFAAPLLGVARAYKRRISGNGGSVVIGCDMANGKSQCVFVGNWGGVPTWYSPYTEVSKEELTEKLHRAMANMKFQPPLQGVSP